MDSATVLQTGGGRTQTVAGWARELGCNPETLRRAIRLGHLKAEIDPLSVGPGYVIRADDLADLLERRKRRYQKQA